MLAGPPAEDSDLDSLVSEESAARIRERRKQQQNDDFCWVLPENWNAIKLLQACDSQWRFSFSGQALGLRYDGVDVVIRRGGFEPLEQDDWERLQLAEKAARSELNKRLSDE